MEWLREVRLALRSFLKQPGFALNANVTLPRRIGATTAILTLV